MKRNLTIEEFSRHYNVSRTQTYEALNRGELLAIKVGARTLIPADHAEAWQAARPAYQPRIRKA
jgi:excisionase family DNA binding protein